MLDLRGHDESPPPNRGWIYAGALLVSVLACYLALWLGAWGFDYRRHSQHELRLRRLVQQEPTLDRVVRGLADDGSPLVASPDGLAALEKVAHELGGPKAEEVLAKGRRWPTTRVFAAGDMVYFLYFDRDDVLRDFAYVSKRGRGEAPPAGR